MRGTRGQWAGLAAFALSSLGSRTLHAEPVVLDVRAESGMLGHSFRYTDPIADHLPDLAAQRPPDNVVPAASTFRLRLESYPLAALTRAWPALIGLHLDLSGSLPTSVRGGPGEALLGSQTQGQAQVGAQVRLDWGTIELLPRAAWGLHGSYLDWTDPAAAPFPDVTYSYLEFGGRLRARVDQLTLEGRLGVRPLLSLGAVGGPAWFPGATGIGMVAGASAGWAFHPSLSLLVNLDFTQYGLSFHPDLGAPPERFVGGANDQFVAVTLGLCWRLPSPARAR
jgi:hypothetical protein